MVRKTKNFEVSGVGLLIIVFGLFLYTSQKGIGLLLITLGMMKLFWDVLRYY